MLMTQTEINNLLNQVNAAFKEQSDSLKELKAKLDLLEQRFDAEEKKIKKRPGRPRRVQQPEEGVEERKELAS
jgi:uncharacterized coiled-coil protein SlyX